MMPLGYAEKRAIDFRASEKKPPISGEVLGAVGTVAVPNQVPIYEAAKIRRRRIAGLTLSNAALAGATGKSVSISSIRRQPRTRRRPAFSGWNRVRRSQFRDCISPTRCRWFSVQAFGRWLSAATAAPTLAIGARLRRCAQQTYSQGEENCSSSRSTERRGVSIA
jgi:hypothetical protein